MGVEADADVDALRYAAEAEGEGERFRGEYEGGRWSGLGLEIRCLGENLEV